jgi:DNA-binding NarL/FixJ family response regulator
MAQPTRVLIADDNVHTREGLRVLLATWPQIRVVAEAADGQEALQQVTDIRPDLVLMDLHMPRLDGVAATRMIKQRWPKVMVVVLTINAAEQPGAMAAGADAFLVKGGSPERLLVALSALIARREQMEGAPSEGSNLCS